MERLGIFGGTFDPVHVGHLAAACAAHHQLRLSRLLIVVARDPWQKHGSVGAPAEDRLAMVEAAIAGVDGLEASRLELDRPGPTYTIDTVEQLQQTGREIVLIVGGDVAAHIETWHRVDDLRAAVTLAVVDRDEGGAPLRAAGEGWRVEHVLMPRLDVSSTDLRRRVAAGEPVEFLVPVPAVKVLQARGLYTGGR
ncbi:MAG TPA: nicotinate-nucleotide adenylyltransferase [Acidimicrobiia bacterium]|nr:nicotinate-nucleotide adenylyltransferase [Acidimicrobiia bacterium]